MNKFFTPTSIRVSRRLNDYLKENFGYEISGDLKALQKAKIQLERMQESGKNYVETTMMLEAVKAMLKARFDEATSAKTRALDKADKEAQPKSKVTVAKAPWDKKKEEVKEAAKPDFLDVDGDGNTEEPMKKALADKTKQDTKKTFPNVKHTTKSGNPDWKKHGITDTPTVESTAKDRALDKAEKEAQPKSKVTVANAPWDKKKEEVKEASTSKLIRYGAAAAGDNSDKRVAGKKMADEKIRKADGKSSSAKVAATKKVTEVDMGQAKSVQDKKDDAGSKSGNKYNVVNKAGKVVSSHTTQGDAIKAANKNEEHKVKKISEATTLHRVMLSQLNAILEGDAASAEITMAARGIVDELQDIIEKLGKIQNDQLGPLADQMAYSHGGDQSATFKSSVDTAISGLLDNARSAKDEVNNAVLILSGEQPAMDTMAPTEEDIGGDMGADFEKDVKADVGTDITGGDEALSGPTEEPLGRARR